MHMSDTIFSETARIIAEKIERDPAEISPETELSTIDIQSLELAEVIFDLEDRFEIEIELNAADAWEQLKTVGDVCDAVRGLVEKSASA